MRNDCARCGRRGKYQSVCLSCDLFIGRQTLPGVKPDAVKKAKTLARSAGLYRLRGKVYTNGKYKTWEQGCNCPSGTYRGLTGASCYHSRAVQLLNGKGIKR